ncbi:TetR family transcriptional regulator [Amycolatopsis sp. RM579]|uniref:TetR family transcriptional regulator n=1 Tax=Amycolatopsis pithecellobii TaxID=664692 RepID=A0A6N7Z9G1_9PSEU|nr:TetR family transcriptional regulator [Amycolatopsis pithecellobii]
MTTHEPAGDEQRLVAEIRRFAAAPFDARPAPTADIDDLDLRLFHTTYLPSFVAPESLEDNRRPVETDLAWLRLVTPAAAPTNLGVLTIGKDPSAHVPGAYVQFVRYQGLDLGAPVGDQHELRGNLVGTATRLGALLSANLRTKLTEGEGLFREETLPDYPLEALRETCMNALMHRDYERSNAPVRIAWFDDRIEVTNPGGPYGQVRADNFDRVSDYRNPGLARAMKALGYVNRFGRGIWRIRTAMARAGSPVPEFHIDETSWCVVLRKWP